MPEHNFILGESLIWQNRVTPDAQLVKRPVAYRGMQNGLAVVSFGLTYEGEPNLFSVSPAELTRPVTPQHVKPPSPPEPEIIPLATRRHALSLRFHSYNEAMAIVNEAEELVNRAEIRVHQAQRALREYADLEKHAIDAVVHELKLMNGGTLTHPVADDQHEWTNREKGQRNCTIAEAALSRFAAELANARSIATERLQLVHKAAAVVVAGIVERETERLAELESQAIQLRLVLRAAANLWLDGQPVPVDQKASTILTAWPFDHEDPVGLRMQLVEQRQAPFAHLFSELCNGNIDADLTV